MLKLIVAMDANRGIGLNEKMPWHIPEEMKIFRTLTLNHSLLFGRTTFEGLAGLLKNRKHYVSTSNPNYQREGVIVINDLDAFLKKHQDSDELIFVSGGASIYKQAFPYVSEAYISILKTSYPCDTFMPELDLSDFECVESIEYEAFNHYHYRRKN